MRIVNIELVRAITSRLNNDSITFKFFQKLKNYFLNDQ